MTGALAPDGCSITVLRTTGRATATKRWSWEPHLREWRKISYQAGALFSPQEVSVANLEALVTVLERVQRDPRAFVVRGDLSPTVREQLVDNPALTIRRRKHLIAPNETGFGALCWHGEAACS